ncbi:MAG: RNA methyltransferase [Bacteroidales bacterium]|nr:RNA methyltransferase [Bacteroidales bacterium]
MKNRKLLSIELGRISPEQYKTREPSGLVLVLDNVRSAHNVGSAFRSGDAFGVDRIFLCGITAVPPSAEIHKSALGAEDSVPWERCESALEAVGRLKEDGYTVVSVEQTVQSVRLDSFTPEKGKKYALVFGNEVEGIGQDVVDASDISLEVPQQGIKHSLNVSVCIGVILWHFRYLLG